MMKLFQYLLLSAGLVAGLTTVEAGPKKKNPEKRQREEASVVAVEDPTVRDVSTQASDENRGFVLGNVRSRTYVRDRNWYPDKETDMEDCAICQEHIDPGSDIEPGKGFKECQHDANMHSTCAARWAAENEAKGCPLCRKEQTDMLRHAASGLSCELKELSKARLKEVLTPFIPVIVKLAQNEALMDPLKAILQDLRILAEHPQQFKADIIKHADDFFQQVTVFEDTELDGAPNHRLLQLLRFEGLRNWGVGALQSMQRGLALGERIISPSPVNLDQLQDRMIRLLPTIYATYKEDLLKALVESLTKFEEFCPDIQRYAQGLRALMVRGVGQDQVRDAVTSIGFSFLISMIQLFPDSQEGVQGLVDVFYQENSEVKEQVLGFCHSVRELGAILKDVKAIAKKYKGPKRRYHKKRY